MKKLIYILMLVFFFFSKTQFIYSQEKISKKAISLYNESVELSYKGQLDKSIEKLNQALNAEPNYLKALKTLARIYQSRLNDYAKAAEYYDKITSIDSNEILSYYNKAICEFNLKDFEGSIKSVDKYLSFEKITGLNAERGHVILRNIEFSKKEFLNITSSVVFENLGKEVNSVNDEYFPSLTSDNRFLYYTIKKLDDPYSNEDIYNIENIEGEWSRKRILSGTINSKTRSEGAHCISSSGKYLLFSSNNNAYGNLGRFDIFLSKKTGTQWSRPMNMGKNINSYDWDSQPVLSSNSKELYFVSSKRGGLGGSDIYVSTIGTDGKFGEAKNIGDIINTPFDEQRPYLHPDGKTLYFSSAGHPGMGANDLYKSTKDENGNWTEPVNLGFPINTSEIELGIFVTADGKKAFISSDRKGGFGGQDIYSFEMPEMIKPNLVSYIKGVVSDYSNKLIKANIKLYDLETGEIYKTFSSDAINGEFLATILGGKDYAFEVEASGYLPFSENISLKKLETNEAFVFNVNLDKIETGKEITLRNIFFNTGKFDLLNMSKIELDFFIVFLEKNSNLLIEIGGHTDNVGLSSSNQILSENRAKSVRDYLITKGISSNRLTFKGYGDSKPVDSNDTEKGRAANRRTSFTLK